MQQSKASSNVQPVDPRLGWDARIMSLKPLQSQTNRSLKTPSSGGWGAFSPGSFCYSFFCAWKHKKLQKRHSSKSWFARLRGSDGGKKVSLRGFEITPVHREKNPLFPLIRARRNYDMEQNWGWGNESKIWSGLSLLSSSSATSCSPLEAGRPPMGPSNQPRGAQIALIIADQLGQSRLHLTHIKGKFADTHIGDSI